MARHSKGFYDTIEYIGQRPQKPRRSAGSVFGGWVILLIVGGAVFWFGRTLMPTVLAANAGGTLQQADAWVDKLSQSDEFGDRLAAAALEASKQPVTFDDSYFELGYPNGDVPRGKSNAEDLVVRCYRKLGIDLQKEVHEDMTQDFRSYPSLWQAQAPDRNIDHRRAQNLQKFFERNKSALKATRNPGDYRPGDIVVWTISRDATTHIGIVVPSPNGNPNEPWVVHCNKNGIKWENCLLDSPISGHCRYGK